MPLEREPRRPRSHSDPTAATRTTADPGKRTLTEALPARRASIGGAPAGDSAGTGPAGRSELAPRPAEQRSSPPSPIADLFGPPGERRTDSPPSTALRIRIPGTPAAAVDPASPPPSPSRVPLPDSPVETSAPPSPSRVPLPDSPVETSAPPSPSRVPLPDSPVTGSLHLEDGPAVPEREIDREIDREVDRASLSTGSPARRPVALAHDHDTTAAALDEQGVPPTPATPLIEPAVHAEHPDLPSPTATDTEHAPTSPIPEAPEPAVPAFDHEAPAPTLATPAPPALAANPTATDTPRSTWERRAEYYKATSYLTAAFGTLISAIGWILLRRYPLMQPVGQGLASGLKNGFGAMDDAHKGNRPKAAGQTVSAAGQAVAMAGVVTTARNPGAAQLTGVRAAGSGLNGAGMLLTGIGEAQSQNPAKAASNFVAAALNLVGVVGYTVEAAGSVKTAFLGLEGVNNFNNSATPIGGAIDDGRKSKVKQPWLRDPKVVGQQITDLGFALSAIAATLNKVYLTHDKEAGTQDSQRLEPLIAGLGAAGMFLATVGYGFSTYAELPRRPAGGDIELGPQGPAAT